MTVAIVRDPIYRGRRFQSEIIELCVRWYLTYRLSYRDLVEMLAERGVIVSHTSMYRCVQQYVPEFDRRWSRYAKAVHPSWRVDETAISVRGGHRYLYRAVDKFGKTVDSLLCADRRPKDKTPQATRSPIDQSPPAHLNFHDLGHISAIVNSAPRRAFNCSRSNGNLFTLPWNPCSRSRGNVVHHRVEYAIGGVSG